MSDSKGWIGLAAAAVAVVLVLAWGIWGTIPDQVEMSVEMVRDGAFANVAADADGTVTEVLVVPGDAVDVGDAVARITSPEGRRDLTTRSAGTVQGVMVSVGDEVQRGDLVLGIVDETSQGTLSAVSYVDANEAVELGAMPDTVVHPATVDGAEYGSLEGVVSFVADVPASVEEMTATLQSVALAQALMEATGGVPYLVRITFDDPPEWTNDQAPPFAVTDGTRGEAIATIGAERPIDLLFGG